MCLGTLGFTWLAQPSACLVFVVLRRGTRTCSWFDIARAVGAGRTPKAKQLARNAV